ncbi:MAG: hypothetical protein IKD69_09430, partial [Solobacterium sp.]|nr:hypothetical protein [Solobacterium sp.]
MKLQNVLLMNRDICPEEALYVRKDGKKLSFDTYFNIFSIAKWRLYTEIASFFLHLEITGRGMVTLYDQNGRIGEYLVEGSTDVTIPQRPDPQCVWFVLRLVEGEFVCGYYGTKQAPAHDVRIALDICTFKREAYLKR